MRFNFTITVAFLLLSQACIAQSAFKPGMVIKEFGKVANVESDVTIPTNTVFKIRFDVGTEANVSRINKSFDSAARFINLQTASGTPIENIQLAIVVHGRAAKDLLQQEFYRAEHQDEPNASASAVSTLQKHGVQFFLCGQSAAYHEVTKTKLLPGVKIAPSAMTIHAILDQNGYALNPF